jgi:hypothetical protein
MEKTKRFRTSGGYLLLRLGGVWCGGGDLVFDDIQGLPVDCFKEPLEGDFLPDEIEHEESD